MKIRTRLILLLAAALGVTMAVSTLLRIRWMRQQLEQNLRITVQDSAEAIAADLTRNLTPDLDNDEVAETLRKVKLRHPVVADVQLTLDTDEETVSTFSLASESDQPTVAKRPRTQRNRGEKARLYDSRRALLDRGHVFRRPAARFEGPLWRTPDRGESSRWPVRVAGVVPPAPAPSARQFREGERGSHPVYEVRMPIDPEGPWRGELTISVTREPIEQILRTETLTSSLVAAVSMLVLTLLTAFIIERVVSGPVTNLEAAMKRVESGSLAERVKSERQDEIGALERGFDAMIERIAEADASIRAFNRRLADEVHAATVDLAQKNEVLDQLNRVLLETRRELGDKERLAALGQLAGQLAHEIGTPLASVSGHLQLALILRDLPAPLRERLLVAEREIERISRIVRDYLDSTRRVVPQPSAIDLERVLDEAIGVALGRRPVAVERVWTDRPASIVTDPGLMRQILINLLTNAADAVAHLPRGTITVTIAAPGADLAIAVRDNGDGIAAEDLQRIFEPFYTTKGRGKGTGLGLAICRELATALGGRIAVESQPGHGSTFTVRVPRVASTPTEASA